MMTAPLFYHVGRYEIGLTEGGNDDVGLAAHLFQIFRGAVAYGDSGIARIGFLHHEHGNRLADDIAATQYDTVFAFGVDVIAFEQLHDAGRGSRYEAGQADRHAAYVDGGGNRRHLFGSRWPR